MDHLLAQCDLHEEVAVRSSSAWLVCVLRCQTSSPITINTALEEGRQVIRSHLSRIPLVFYSMSMQLCQSCSSASSRQKRCGLKIIVVSWCSRTRIFTVIVSYFVIISCKSLLEAYSIVCCVLHTRLRNVRAWLWWRSFGWRGTDHQLKALLGSWELRDVVFWVSSTNVLLHRSVALLL
jgi:hypothetical protein